MCLSVPLWWAGFYDGKPVSDSPSEDEPEDEEEEEEADDGVSSDTDDEAEKTETLQMKVMRIAKGMTVSDLLTPRGGKVRTRLHGDLWGEAAPLTGPR